MNQLVLPTRADQGERASKLQYKKRSQPGAWIFTVAVAVAFLGFVIAVAESPAIHFSEIGQYLFEPRVLAGVKVTVGLTIAGVSIGIAWGLLLACARLSRIKVARVFSAVYVWIFLSVPGLVQLIFWYNIAIVFPRIELSLPFFGTVWQRPTNSVITAITASIIGLGLLGAAYFAEIIRSGIISVDQGQIEAAQSLGIRRRTILFKIVLPQAFRVMLPSGMTRFVAMMKDTSLVAVIGGGDLMTRAQEIYNNNFLIIELLLVVCIWYLFLVSLLMLAQSAVERWASRYLRASREIQQVMKMEVKA